jgi:hypothetical protein
MILLLNDERKEGGSKWRKRKPEWLTGENLARRWSVCFVSKPAPLPTRDWRK